MQPLSQLLGACELAGQGPWLPSSPALCQPRVGQPHGCGSCWLPRIADASPERKQLKQNSTEWAGSSFHRKGCFHAHWEKGARLRWEAAHPGCPPCSPVLLGVVHYGPDLQFSINLWPPKLLQFHLLGKEGKAVNHSASAAHSISRKGRWACAPGARFTQRPEAGKPVTRPSGSWLVQDKG